MITKVINLLQARTENISYEDLLTLKREYYTSLADNLFPKPPVKPSTIQMIKYLKRKNAENVNKIGPYENITVFEAANRIGSDLVLINGIIQLIEDGHEHPDSRITLLLGTRHLKGKGDFWINEKQGEAFNVAESFYQSKLDKTLKKWENGHLDYILINAEVVNATTIDFLIRLQGTRIIPVRNWDK